MNDMNETSTSTENSAEVLVVASKVKSYIKKQAGLNTSGAVMEVLSLKVRQICDQAIESAKSDGRKTVMDRDFNPEGN